MADKLSRVVHCEIVAEYYLPGGLIGGINLK